jgi:hypothetical protein
VVHLSLTERVSKLFDAMELDDNIQLTVKSPNGNLGESLEIDLSDFGVLISAMRAQDAFDKSMSDNLEKSFHKAIAKK